jgi:hypothetical protein
MAAKEVKKKIYKDGEWYELSREIEKRLGINGSVVTAGIRAQVIRNFTENRRIYISEKSLMYYLEERKKYPSNRTNRKVRWARDSMSMHCNVSRSWF